MRFHQATSWGPSQW